MDISVMCPYSNISEKPRLYSKVISRSWAYLLEEQKITTVNQLTMTTDCGQKRR